ncbi:DUF4332 domain-containing protein [Rhodopirellula sp. P2]|uniref:DUF4332 domain-containing protein n=1 Tax=Rhodopirellula sp. P2 TaxID=2127060 RepID=UPI0023679816|nr:DUF4332 domain-containing protein [Rhodopirellula sp. P2]WDQ15806.1 DUF4332 domain-containing protein [Rhodopirellula sp. P2]
MLLDRIEIDNHGPLNRVELGPLSHHLNVVLGPIGSGKTAISRFIRDSLVSRNYPTGMLSGSTGRVVWVDNNGWVHCRREADGTSQGRRTVEFEPRSETTTAWEGYHDGWFGDSSDASPSKSNTTLAARALRSVQMPESIVDGVMVDTTVTNVSRVVAACIQSGLDHEGLATLPYESETARYTHSHPAYSNSVHSGESTHSFTENDDRRRRALRSELADIEAQLASLPTQDFDSSDWQDNSLEHDAQWTNATRRAEQIQRELADIERQRVETLRLRESLTARRQAIHAQRSRATRYDSIHAERRRQHTQRLHELHTQADSLRARAAGLKRWIADLDAKAYSTPRSTYTNQPFSYGTDPLAYAPDHRDHYAGSDYRTSDLRYAAKLSATELRDQLRHADTEIIQLRRTLAEIRGLRDSIATARQHTASVDIDGIRGRRYDHFIHAIDRYSVDHAWDDFYRDAYRPLHQIDDIDLRINSATQQIDWLLGRIERESTDLGTVPVAPAPFEPLRGAWNRQSSLAATLRQIRSELRRSPYVVADHVDNVTRQLADTLDQLLIDRARIVEELAASRSELHDFATLTGHHPDWVAERNARLSELNQTETQLRSVLDETARVRRSLRSLPIVDVDYPIGMPESALDVNSVDDRLHRIDRELQVLAARQHELERIPRDIPVRPAPRPVIRNTRRAELLRRRDELITELNRYRPATRAESSLVELASRWLVRLSGGRHRRVTWTTSVVNVDPHTLGHSHAEQRFTNTRAMAAGRQVHVRIDDQDETNLPGVTRAIAAMAVRMAAGELMDRTGRAVPLVLETHREMFAAVDSRTDMHGLNDAFRPWTAEGVTGDAIASALSDYASSGRQIVLLTSHEPLASSLSRSGARTFRLHASRVVHAHQPVWRNGRRHDRYVGPHGLDSQTELGTGDRSRWAHGASADVNHEFEAAYRETAGLDEDQWVSGPAPIRGSRPTHEQASVYPAAPVHTTAQGHSPNGSSHNGFVPSHSASATDHAPSGTEYRDGYYYADQTSSTIPMNGNATTEHGVLANGHAAETQVNETPFFLTVDSPIDSAPSIDGVAAARLRRIGISHITHLMNQDSNRLADTLGLAGVDARTIRRWQSECRLMCRVPQLRGFDARVLVGCGVNDPAQLAAIHPSDLLDQVKTFLATERGQRILLSGTSYELSRITSWIASANQSTQSRTRTRTVDGRTLNSSSRRAHSLNGRSVGGRHAIDRELDLRDDDAFDQERYEVESARRSRQLANEMQSLRESKRRESERTRSRTTSSRDSESGRSGRTRTSVTSKSNSRTRTNPANGNGSGNGNGNGNGSGHGSANGSGSGSGHGNGSGNGNGSANRTQGVVSMREHESSRGQRSSRSERDSRGEREPRAEREARGERYERAERSERSSSRSSSNETELRFYLERASDVVDAPSIGPRMAERLNEIGIYTVDDLLKSTPEKVAEQLNHRRVDAETVLTWQQQTTLVCRVPMMRGHDAQFLVAAGVTSAEELADQNPVTLFGEVDAISHSREGKRIARGGKLPDLEEVTEWVTYASQHRSLQAA